jgi:hypothetical protein
MNRISFKVYFALDNIRRFTTESVPSLQEFNSIINKLSPTTSQARRVQYKDIEGDLITIDSECEWEEMFSQYSDLKLYRIYISESSNTEREVRQVKPISLRRNRPRGRVLYPYVLQCRGLNHLTHKQYHDASLTFRTQCSMQPDNPTPFYNVACCESLMGNTANAFEFLEKAINLGFNDLENMLKDEDLANIRKTDQFEVACDRIRNSTNYQNTSPINSHSKPTEIQPDQNTPTDHKPIALQPDQNTSLINNDPKPIEHQQNTSPINTHSKPTEIQPNQNTSPIDHKPIAPNQNTSPIKGPKPKVAQKPSPWASQLKILHDMGYYNDELFLRLLDNFRGDIQRTLEVLIGE